MSYGAVLQRRWTDPSKTIQTHATVAATTEGEESTAVPAASCVKDIWRAAIEGDVECLQANVSLGVDVNALGQPGPGIWGPRFGKCGLFKASPLHFAASFGREEAVRFLLANGARVEQRSASGLTAKEYARRRQYEKIVAMLDGR